MSTTTMKQFTLYAPSTQKSYELNPDGTLTIEGIASTTNKDLQGEFKFLRPHYHYFFLIIKWGFSA